MLSAQLTAFELPYQPATNDLQAAFVFDFPLVNNIYEVSLTPSWIMGGHEITSKTINGFNMAWNNAAPAGSTVLIRVIR